MARTGRPKAVLEVTDAEREVLQRYARRGKTSQRTALRARIVLECAKGLSNEQVGSLLAIHVKTVGKWRARFIASRLDGLVDAPRPGAPRSIGDEKVEEIVRRTLEEMPKGSSRWSTRQMAKSAGISRDSVSRIWRTFGLKPHRSETFQLSTDPDFIDKVRDVVGLYMAPPDNAIVLSVDEKSQIQALNRTQPLLPLRPGQAERHTPEYERNGTTNLFAALDVATGSVIAKCYQRHRTTEFVKFLKHIDTTVDPALEVHIILDNYATHKAPALRTWLAKHPRFQLHFTPTHASWLNQIECWFSLLTEKQLKRGSHHSVSELLDAIQDFLDAHNSNPTPFRWTKTADDILTKLARSCAATLRIHSQGITVPTSLTTH
jgi:transposase